MRCMYPLRALGEGQTTGSPLADSEQGSPLTCFEVACALRQEAQLRGNAGHRGQGIEEFVAATC